jgi:hypothetical protein
MSFIYSDNHHTSVTFMKLKPITIPSLCILGAFVTGCANTAQYLRSQPLTYYNESTTTSIVLTDPDLKQLFEVKCMKVQSRDFLTTPDQQSAQCLYIAVNGANATYVKDSASSPSSPATRAVRDKAIAYLIGISDFNCTNYLDRAFANKAGLDISKSFTSDIATGISAITAFNTPAVSAALSLANLVVGKTVDNINATYYFDKTFQAFEAAVLAERARIRSDILARQANRPIESKEFSPVQYGLFEALADIKQYDDACSMRVGLSKLIEAATVMKQNQTLTSAKADNKATNTSLEYAYAEQTARQALENSPFPTASPKPTPTPLNKKAKGPTSTSRPSGK